MDEELRDDQTYTDPQMHNEPDADDPAGPRKPAEDVTYEYEAEVDPGPSFSEQQQYWNDIQDTMTSSKKEYDRIVVDPAKDPEQSDKVKELRSRIAAIEKEVKRTGKYYDKDQQKNLDWKQAEKKIINMKKEIGKEKGEPWYEQPSANPFEAILKFFVRTIAHLIIGDTTNPKNRFNSHGDDLRSQMNAYYSDPKRDVEKDIENYINRNDRTNTRTEKGKDNKEHNSENKKDNKKNRTNEDIYQDNVSSFGTDANTKTNEDVANDMNDILDILGSLDNNSNKSQPKENTENKGGKDKPEPSKPKITDTEKDQKNKEHIRHMRDMYCMAQTGKEYKTLSLEEKAMISAGFIMSERDIMSKGKTKKVHNYDSAGDLEPELINTKEYIDQLLIQYRESLPEKAQKYAVKNISDVIPYYTACKLSEEQDIGKKNKAIAEAVLDNPKVLEHIPKDYLEENLSDIGRNVPQALVEKHIADEKRHDRDVKRSKEKPYEVPPVTKYLDQISRQAERRDNNIEKMEKNNVEVTDRSNIYKDFVDMVYTTYALDYINGYGMNLDDATLPEEIAPIHVTLYDDVIESKEFNSQIEKIAADPENRALMQELLDNTINRIDQELEMLSEEYDSDRIEDLNNEKKGLKIHIIDCFEKYKTEELAPETPEQGDEIGEGSEEYTEDGPVDTTQEQPGADESKGSTAEPVHGRDDTAHEDDNEKWEKNTGASILEAIGVNGKQKNDNLIQPENKEPEIYDDNNKEGKLFDGDDLDEMAGEANTGNTETIYDDDYVNDDGRC